jgi:hypothetical protein
MNHRRDEGGWVHTCSYCGRFYKVHDFFTAPTGYPPVPAKFVPQLIKLTVPL